VFVAWEQIFLMKNLENISSFGSSRLLERDLLLLRVKRLNGWLMKDGSSVKDELFSSVLSVLLGDWSIFDSLLILIIIF
jgi:hypothetical protein